jgi:hypothetical protein
MAETNIIVTLDLKEIQDAVIETASKHLAQGQQTGSCRVEFGYDEQGKVTGSEVHFKYSKQK